MDIQKENNLIQEAFEVEADEIGFCLDQKWGDYENPYENSDTALAFNLFKKGWQAAKDQAIPEGFVLVPKEPTEEMLIKGNRLALADKGYRYDATSIWETMLEAARGGNE